MGRMNPGKATPYTGSAVKKADPFLSLQQETVPAPDNMQTRKLGQLRMRSEEGTALLQSGKVQTELERAHTLLDKAMWRHCEQPPGDGLERTLSYKMNFPPGDS